MKTPLLPGLTAGKIACHDPAAATAGFFLNLALDKPCSRLHSYRRSTVGECFVPGAEIFQIGFKMRGSQHILQAAALLIFLAWRKIRVKEFKFVPVFQRSVASNFLYSRSLSSCIATPVHLYSRSFLRIAECASW